MYLEITKFTCEVLRAEVCVFSMNVPGVYVGVN